MLRFLSNYLFQNENQPNENDPTSVTNSEEQQQPGPTTSDKKSHDKLGGDKSGEFMDLELRDDEESEEDDWVLIGEGKRKTGGEEDEVEIKKPSEDDLRVQCQPVNLVAAPSTEEEDEEDSEEEEEEEEEEDDEEEEEGLIWENKLIEHPSMSVYVDLATSVNGVTASCVSLSSICPASSPKDSVIILEQPDSDLEETMDFVKDTENQAEIPTSTKTSSSSKPAPPVVQNGRRKKGHYPCSSSNSSQMPRRAHLRSCGGTNTASNTTTPTQSFSLGSAAADVAAASETIKRIKRGNATPNNGNSTTVSACGIAMVNGGTSVPPTVNSNGMLNKNLKLSEMFPMASAACKRRQRKSPSPQKCGATSNGHFLQEGKRRQDMQNYTKRAFVNNDRRSATQRRVTKMPAGGAGGK